MTNASSASRDKSALFDFKDRYPNKRALWICSKEMIPELETLLDVV